jgi:hypothetical protein
VVLAVSVSACSRSSDANSSGRAVISVETEIPTAQVVSLGLSTSSVPIEQFRMAPEANSTSLLVASDGSGRQVGLGLVPVSDVIPTSQLNSISRVDHSTTASTTEATGRNRITAEPIRISAPQPSRPEQLVQPPEFPVFAIEFQSVLPIVRIELVYLEVQPHDEALSLAIPPWIVDEFDVFNEWFQFLGYFVGVALGCRDVVISDCRDFVISAA